MPEVKYHAGVPMLAFRFTLLGATDAQMADFFEVSVATIHNWKKEHPDFLDAIKRGKLEADASVANRLYSRAMGYKTEESKTTYLPDGSVKERVVTSKEMAPDVVAGIYWLNNRRRDDWKARQNVEAETTNVNAEVKAPEEHAEALARKILENRKKKDD